MLNVKDLQKEAENRIRLFDEQKIIYHMEMYGLNKDPESIENKHSNIFKAFCSYDLPYLRKNLDKTTHSVNYGIDTYSLIHFMASNIFMIKEGYEELLNILITTGEDLNSLNKHNKTPYMIAIEENNDTFIKLIHNKLFGNHINRAKRLFNAIVNNNLTLVKELVEQHSDLMNVYCNNEEKIVSNFKIYIKKEISNGESIEKLASDVLNNNYTLYNPLHYAVKHNRFNIIEYFISTYGLTSFSDDNYNSYTPLHIALKEGHDFVAEYLIENGANITQIKRGVNPVEHMLLFRQTNGASMIKKLASYGYDFNMPNKMFGLFPIHLLVMFPKRNNYKMLLALLGLNINVKVRSLPIAKSQDFNALHFAINSLPLFYQENINALTKSLSEYFDQFKIFDLFINHGLNPLELNIHNVSPIMVSFEYNVPYYYEYLMDQGYQRYKGNFLKNISLILHWAADQNKVEALNYLIQRGADVNHLDYKGVAPLAYAVIKNNYDAASLLLSKGASKDISIMGYDLLYIAKISFGENSKIYKLLED